MSGPEDAQLFNLRPNNSNTTVCDITWLPNSVCECKYSLITLHVVTGCDTISVLYNQGKHIKSVNALKYTSLAKDYLPSIYPRLPHRISSQQISSSTTFAWCPRFHLTGYIQTLCIYTCQVCSRLLQTSHSISRSAATKQNILHTYLISKPCQLQVQDWHQSGLWMSLGMVSLKVLLKTV